MKTNNRQRAMTLDELKKEVGILTKEQMGACKGGESYIRKAPFGNIIFTLIDSGYEGHSRQYSYMQRGYIYGLGGLKTEPYHSTILPDLLNYGASNYKIYSK